MKNKETLRMKMNDLIAIKAKAVIAMQYIIKTTPTIARGAGKSYSCVVGDNTYANAVLTKLMNIVCNTEVVGVKNDAYIIHTKSKEMVSKKEYKKMIREAYL